MARISHTLSEYCERPRAASSCKEDKRGERGGPRRPSFWPGVFPRGGETRAETKKTVRRWALLCRGTIKKRNSFSFPYISPLFSRAPLPPSPVLMTVACPGDARTACCMGQAAGNVSQGERRLCFVYRLTWIAIGRYTCRSMCICVCS